LGNDLGAIRNYVALQDQAFAEGRESIYCIVDYHALTTSTTRICCAARRLRWPPR